MMASRLCQRLMPVVRKKCFQPVYCSQQYVVSSVSCLWRSDSINKCSSKFPMVNYEIGNQIKRKFQTSCSLHHGQVECWNCGASVSEFKDKFFCKCDVIQVPDECQDYFEYLGVERTFDLDTTELTNHFRNLQRFLHPDKFTQKSDKERELSALHSALVNKGYRTLLKPLPRGLYMLKLYGAALEEGEIQMASDFLMEIMEINEELAETNSLKAVQKIGMKNSKVLQQLIKEVSEAFQKEDIPAAKALLAKLKYYANIDDKVKEHERRYAAQMYT